MKKENKKLLVGVIATVLIVGLLGTGYGLWKYKGQSTTTQGSPSINVMCGDGVCHLPEYNGGTCPADCGSTIANSQAPTSTAAGGLVYVDLSGNLMNKAKFATDSSNIYSGIWNQSVKFYDITKNAQNDPRTNILAVPDFQIVAGGVSSSTNTAYGYLSASKKGIAGHTYVYYFENTSGNYYDVTGTFTIPANVNAFAPAFDMGNILAPPVGTLKFTNETGIQSNGDAHAIFGNASTYNRAALDGATVSTDLTVSVGSQTYADFVRIWGEYSSTSIKSQLIGVSLIQKSGPTVGVTIDSSDSKNPIITINELTAQFPLTFTYYLQGQSKIVGYGNYTIYGDDWNAVPGKFGSKISTDVVIAYDDT